MSISKKIQQESPLGVLIQIIFKTVICGGLDLSSCTEIIKSSNIVSVNKSDFFLHKTTATKKMPTSQVCTFVQTSDSLEILNNYSEMR